MTHVLASIDGEWIPIIGIVGGLAIAAIAIIAGTLKSASDRKQTEQTKREIAAYVAEGSMTPEEGERLLRANSPRSCR